MATNKRAYMNNPYNLSFGKRPLQMIERTEEEKEVYSAFVEDDQQTLMITGVRGCGKTVFLRTMAREFRMKEDWVVVELNPVEDISLALLSRLSSMTSFSSLFKNAGINLSFWQFGINIKNQPPITDTITALTEVLKVIKRQGKKVLIILDEVVANQYIKTFSHDFQILMGDDLPVYLLMAGLYQNISLLQNEKTLTFLYRTPKLFLPPFPSPDVAGMYQYAFGIDSKLAIKMAKTSGGYAYAFQLLGFFMWKFDDFEKAKSCTKQSLFDYSYEKIWDELSDEQQKMCLEIINPRGKNFSKRSWKELEREGITNEKREFVLPMFDDFIKENIE